MRISLRLPFVLSVAALAALAFSAAPAFGEEALSPWWHLSTSLRPSYLQPGKARDEVQRFSGGGVLEDEGAGLYGASYGERDQEQAVSAGDGEAPEDVQKGLEGIYGVGNVEVTSTPPFTTYEVTFVGELADQPVETMRCGGCANVTEVTKGRPDGEIVVNAMNLGDAAVDPEAHPVTITDELPKGLVAVGIYASMGQTLKYWELGKCSLKTVSCTIAAHPTRGVANVPPYHPLQVAIAVNVVGAQSGEVNNARIVGGGAPPATASGPVTVSGAPVPFAVNTYEIRPEEVGGKLDTQAGSHPFQLTTTLNFNERLETRLLANDSSLPLLSGPADGMAKDLHFNLPAGLIGNPQALPACPIGTFLKGAYSSPAPCPSDTVIGVAVPSVFITEKFTYQGPIQAALYNLEPAVGEPARFGFIVYGDPVLLDASVRTGSDYGVTVSVENITQTAEFLASEVTFWGVPGDSRHDQQRCKAGVDGFGECSALEARNPGPFLSLPTSCSGLMPTDVEGDSWQQEAQRKLEGLPPLVSPLASFDMGGLDGCNRLPFTPSIKVTPDGQAGSTPTGLNVDVHVNQDSILSPSGLAESNVKTITVALPEGVAINPAGGDGLEACSEGLVGFKGGFEEPPLEPGVSVPVFSPRLPGSTAALGAGEKAALEPGVNFCANASKIAQVTIKSPLLPAGQFLKGFVYLAAQEANPFGSLVAMYLVAEDPISGTVVKLPGVVHLEPSGQIVSTFADNPQLPFEDAELHFFGGERAPLASPARCGTYTTQASFEPWSGNGAVPGSSSFEVKSGPNGTPCPGASLPFSPSLTAGMTNINAGSFSPFTMTMSRASGQQNLQSIELKMPPGLSGVLAGTELCPEPQADQGLCGPNSLIGETTVGVGVGGDPFSVKGGKVYLTGPYEGAPFGLSIVNPAKAGPYDLAATKGNHPACDCVLVRAKIEINPITAALTVTSDNSGPYKIPTSIEGIPLQIQHVNVLIDRPGFQFNPTSCDPSQIGGNLAAAEGASSALAVPFQVTNCGALKFEPTVVIQAPGKASKANGEALNFKIAYPKGAMGKQAWFNEAKFTLPKQLPARLTTLQQACLASVFEHNRAACPAASIIGHAVVHTEVLPVPLEGPVYFVSYGGAKFPEAVIYLQGYGVKVELHGETFISKGITSATFRNQPDVPFESIEVNIPTGPFSEFGANLPPKDNYNFCGQKLVMPTLFKAANGLEINQSTPVNITGCPRSLTRAQQMAAALKACHKDKNKHKRAICEAQAHKKYGHTAKNTKNKK